MLPRLVLISDYQMPKMKSFFLYALFFLSGAAGLGYEILWTRMLSISLGHEIVSVLAVVSAFFSGLALGAWFLDRPVGQSTSPGIWYVAIESVIGLWALLLMGLLPEINIFVSGLIGTEPSSLRHWFISFTFPFLILLPATFAMGGTLPAMDRFVQQVRSEQGAVAGLYSINTFGAVLGTLMVTFFVLPAYGMKITTICLSMINFICAVGVLGLSKKNKTADEKNGRRHQAIKTGRLRRHLILFMTGFLGIGFEVLMVRVLSQVLENTVFSFASMLMVFLFGTAAGAGIYQKVRRFIDFERGLSFMLLTTAFLCLLSIFLLRYVEGVFHFLKEMMGHGLNSSVAAELALSMFFFFLPTASMGATFGHLAQSLKGKEYGVGRALCLNTLGGAAAPIVFGVMLVPAIGIKYTLLMIPVFYILCMPKCYRLYGTTGALLGAVVLYMALNTGGYQFVSIAEKERVVSHREGVMAAVSVIEDGQNEFHLKVNNHFQMGGTTSVFSDRRQAYLPLLLHPNPRHALFLGVGTGTTFAGATSFPNLEAVGVELIPEVLDVMGYFKKATGDLKQCEHLHLINADARRYVTATDQRYDVVIADLFHPARDGAGSLYTLEHFRAIRRLLKENGLFCQWLPLYQLDLETFKVITRTFLEIFPQGQAYLAHYSIDQPIIGLLGGKKSLRFPEKWYRDRVRGKEFRKHISGFGYDSIYSLLGTFLADSRMLRQFAGDVPLNTDDQPVVMFQAPRFVYGTSEPVGKRLEILLEAFSGRDPDSVFSEIVAINDLKARSRLSMYWSARDSFLKLGMRTERTNDVMVLYRKTSDPLLQIVRQSADFSAAYFPLISIACNLYPHDREVSCELLRKLEQASPMRPEAGILRQKLFARYSFSQ